MKKRVETRCAKCNEIILEGATFCRNCGNKLDKDEVVKVESECKCHEHKSVSPIISAVITFIICLIIFGAFYNFYLKDMVIEKTILEKDVTVTDKGIADAVEKIYDAVVVVESYTKDTLTSSGSGFVYKTDDKYSYILTNYHVINAATSVKVMFTNNEKVDVSLVGSDEYTDIAVLKLDKSKIITVAEIGKADELRVGDTTFAVGAPIDSNAYSWTVTRGILSGKNRIVEVSSSNSRNSFVMQVLQTDTAINSGNSGGPLCNANGEVIGITNMKLTSNTIEGMGFAIPIETAVTYADTLINKGTISRPYIGVSISDYSESFFATSTAIVIQNVESKSPADKAGLKSGDKIIKVNDTKVTSSSYFKYELYKYKPGDKITITYERNNKEYTAKVTLGSFNENA